MNQERMKDFIVKHKKENERTLSKPSLSHMVIRKDLVYNYTLNDKGMLKLEVLNPKTLEWENKECDITVKEFFNLVYGQFVRIE